MRIVKESTLKKLCKLNKYKQAEESIKAWIYEVRYSEWNNTQELKAKYRSASIITAKRVVFNVKGNDYRLIVDIEYKLKIVFVVWFGTHVEYDTLPVGRQEINVKTVSYDN
jgi:mRNA interferase HigB